MRTHQTAHVRERAATNMVAPPTTLAQREAVADVEGLLTAYDPDAATVEASAAFFAAWLRLYRTYDNLPPRAVVAPLAEAYWRTIGGDLGRRDAELLGVPA